MKDNHLNFITSYFFPIHLKLEYLFIAMNATIVLILILDNEKYIFGKNKTHGDQVPKILYKLIFFFIKLYLILGVFCL